MQETRVQFLGREDPLEQKMATYSSIPAWRIPWTEEPGRLQSVGSQELDTTERLGTHKPTLDSGNTCGRPSEQREKHRTARVEVI